MNTLLAYNFNPMSKSNEFIWKPSQEYLRKAKINSLMQRLKVADVDSLRKVSVSDTDHFWDEVMKDIGIEWFEPYTRVSDRSQGIEKTKWFENGKINIAHNCVDRHKSSKKTALLWEGDDGAVREIDYGEFYGQVNQTANTLKSFGVTQGDTIGILMPMVPEVVIQLFACFKIGAVAIPIFSGFGVDAVAARLEDAKVKVLFTCDAAIRRGKRVDVKATADAARQNVASLKATIVFKRADGKCAFTDGMDHWWHDLIPKASSDAPSERLESEARALIIYTSGTTGKPKGAIHTHAGCLATIGKELRYGFNSDENSRFFWFTDIGWMMGPWEMIGVTLFGGTLFLFEGAPDYPTPSRLWEVIERHKISVLGISPTAIRLLMRDASDAVKNFSMPTLELLGSTGEPWDPESYEWFFSKVGHKRCPIINISGGTEIIGCLLMPLPVQPLKSCTLGGAGLGVDVDVFDEDGKSVRESVGHLVCKQPLPSMTKGFLNSWDRYLETYFSKFKGVWYHGDWAIVDKDGLWYLRGRSDDTIKIAGKRIGPVEFEAALLQNPKVSEAAAVGVPDELKGESCVCFVVLKPDVEPSETLRTELKSALANSLGKAMAPKEVRFTKMLPKTRSAKILRGIIKKIFLGQTPSDTAAVENHEALDAIRNCT
jgi:acetyl-CoA synthetase